MGKIRVGTSTVTKHIEDDFILPVDVSGVAVEKTPLLKKLSQPRVEKVHQNRERRL